MSEWRRVAIEELAAPGKNSLATGPFGSAISARYFTESGVPVIRGSNLSLDIGERLIDRELVFIPHGLAEKFVRSRVKAGDLVFTCWGTIGQVGLIDDRSMYDEYIVSNKQMKLTPNPDLASSLFLYYAFSNSDFVERLQGISIGSSVPGFNLGQLRSMELVIPALAEQEAVAAVLGALDDNIAVNNELSRTERELARAHLRAAVDSGDSDKVELSSIVEFLNRGVTPRYTEDEAQLRVLNQKCVRDGRVSFGPSRRTLADKVTVPKLLKVNDVLVNSTGVGTLGRVARWAKDEACTVDSHVTIVRFDEAKVDPVCAGIAMLEMEPEIEALGEGSTGQTELSRTQLSALRITLPSRERSAKLRPVLDALESRGDAALSESESLAELRDTLLPKLMSGEIRVRDAEKVVEDVTL
jgi:type I restriction enzyme, S subunit